MHIVKGCSQFVREIELKDLVHPKHKAFTNNSEEDGTAPGFGDVVHRTHSRACAFFRTALLAAAGATISAGVVAAIAFPYGTAALVSAAALALLCGGTAGLLVELALRVRSLFIQFRHERRMVQIPAGMQMPNVGQAAKGDVLLLDDAAEIFRWKKQMLSTAQQTIEISFNFAGGKDLREVLDILRERMGAGVKVHVLMSKDMMEKGDRDELGKVKKEYPDNFFYQVTDRSMSLKDGRLHTEENHAKFMVVDAKYFVLGSSGVHEFMTRANVDGVSEFPHRTMMDVAHDRMIGFAFHESDVVGRGDTAMTIRWQFFELYRIMSERSGHKIDHDKSECQLTALDSAGPVAAFEDFESHTGVFKDVKLRFLASSPEHNGSNPITARLAGMIGSAQERVYMGNLLFHPDPKIGRALKRARKLHPAMPCVGVFNGSRGNDVNHFLVQAPSRNNYGLCGEVHEYGVRKCNYHKKVVVGDDTLMLGSFNLGRKSGCYDYESALVIEDARVADLAVINLQQDIANSHKVDATPLRRLRWRIIGSTVGEFLACFV